MFVLGGENLIAKRGNLFCLQFRKEKSKLWQLMLEVKDLFSSFDLLKKWWKLVCQMIRMIISANQTDITNEKKCVDDDLVLI